MNPQSAINYGLFVQFVADTWNTGSNTNNLDGKAVTDNSNNPIISGCNYTILHTVYANDLATDINPTRPITEGFKTMAIVIANDADPNDIVIAIRGTLTVYEWLQDAKFLYKPFSKVPSAGLTEDGFTDMYFSFSLSNTGGGGDFVTNLKSILPVTARITVVGHSLGAGIASLCAIDLAANTAFPITCYTLASPRVGDLTFANLYNHIVPNAYRVANRLDVVPKVPPPVMYVHVGDETELIPPSNLKFDLGCEHHLTSYFNMLETLINPTSTQYPIQPDCLNGSATPTNAAED